MVKTPQTISAKVIKDVLRLVIRIHHMCNQAVDMKHLQDHNATHINKKSWKG